MSNTSHQLRNFSIKVGHPSLPNDLILDEISADFLKLSCDDPIDQLDIGKRKAAVFHFGNDIRHHIEIDLIDCIRSGKNKTVVSAAFSSPEDDSAFWRALRRHARRADAPTATTGWPRLPVRAQYTEAARRQRVSFLQEHTGVGLDDIAATSLDPESLTRVTEAFIGTVEVPVGAAGPLLFHGQHARGHLFAPMATTEGSLVASAIRGATAITASGGVTTAVLDRRITRVPLFQMADLHDAMFLGQWVQSRFADIRRQTELMSKHAILKRLEPQILGRDLHLHFVYDSADAAGQNMTTGCTWRACHWIMAEIGSAFGLKVERFIIESNLSSDKKVTFNNFMVGRGTRAVAECRLPAEVTQRFLHVTPEQLVRGYHSLAAGGVAGGMIGVNINIANMVAAIFTATGQDIASVHESGVGHLTLDLVDAGAAVYASLVLPSLLIGTVGGGTRLPQQRRCLQMIDCDGAGKSPRLAEIICGFALALDLSTLSALVADEFAAAHHPLVKAGASG
ncbi:MAG: hydroxymethylglutaryl-CoA reductase [Inquilinus sp.]|uniref:hydroxymethylglutaryl-CoA reductase n=1 Tax=Inquilinus sp. TaxID=1932117 RepID=UPI003F35411B